MYMYESTQSTLYVQYAIGDPAAISARVGMSVISCTRHHCNLTIRRSALTLLKYVIEHRSRFTKEGLDYFSGPAKRFRVFWSETVQASTQFRHPSFPPLP